MAGRGVRLSVQSGYRVRAISQSGYTPSREWGSQLSDSTSSSSSEQLGFGAGILAGAAGIALLGGAFAAVKVARKRSQNNNRVPARAVIAAPYYPSSSKSSKSSSKNSNKSSYDLEARNPRYQQHARV